MSYDYNKYIAKYNKENLVLVSLRLHKKHDKDIVEKLDMSNKNKSIKELIRKGLKKEVE